jgi:hypothetical protein
VAGEFSLRPECEVRRNLRLDVGMIRDARQACECCLTASDRKPEKIREKASLELIDRPRAMKNPTLDTYVERFSVSVLSHNEYSRH